MRLPRPIKTPYLVSGEVRHMSDTQPQQMEEVQDFGTNPGSLRMRTHVPHNIPGNAALVVVLHGCTQTAAGYASGAGWCALADRFGFAVLAPEQAMSNNPNRCFNWFQPQHTTRDHGESASIRQMIAAMVRNFAIDPARIFVTGLSAGGAMANAMLANYPEVFAAGAIVAGLPFGAASTMPEALSSMSTPSALTPAERGDIVRAASPKRESWPKLSVWHGSADSTVSPKNAQAIIDQWADVHGVQPDVHTSHESNGHTVRVWHNATAEPVLEAHTIRAMGHGTPILLGSAPEACGAVGPFILSTAISSSYEIARFWGLTGSELNSVAEIPEMVMHARPPFTHPTKRKLASAIEQIISSALTTAGLKRR